MFGADYNELVSEGNRGYEEVMSKFGVKEKKPEEQMVMDFENRMEMAVVTSSQKGEKHNVTNKSGGRSTQVDYMSTLAIFHRQRNLNVIGDYQVATGDSITRHQRMVVW